MPVPRAALLAVHPQWPNRPRPLARPKPACARELVTARKFQFRTPRLGWQKYLYLYQTNNPKPNRAIFPFELCVWLFVCQTTLRDRNNLRRAYCRVAQPAWNVCLCVWVRMCEQFVVCTCRVVELELKRYQSQLIWIFNWKDKQQVGSTHTSLWHFRWTA